MDSMELVLQELQKINGRMDNLEHKVDKLVTDVTEMKADVTELKTDVSELKEDHEVTRDGVNTLIAWADRVAVVVKMPLQ